MKKTFFLILLLLTIAISSQIIVEEIGVASEQIDKASELFKNYKFEKVIETLSPLISNFQGQEKEGRLQENDEDFYKKSLELRAISFFNLGKESLSREDFTNLLKLDPNYNIQFTTSTKISRFYNSIRESLCGFLILNFSPSDSIITIDSKSYKQKDVIYLLEGLHILKVEMMGYDSITKEINITKGVSLQETIKLKPNSRKVFFFVKPKGAKLFIDDRFAGSADEKAASREDWEKYVSSSGFSPSSFYVVESLYLSPGNHKIEITAPCHSSRIFSLPISLDLETNKPGFIKPIELIKETLTLTISSYPSKAAVEIDGQKVGSTPLKLENFCSGEHFFRIFKEGQGEYRKRIDLRGFSSYELKAKLRPTLLWIGLSSDQEITHNFFLSLSESFKKGMSQIETFNVTFSEEANLFLPDLFYTKGVSEEEKNKTVSELCSKYKCEGALVAKCFSKGDNQIISLRLYLPEIKGFDEITSLILDTKDISFFLKKFDNIGEEKTFGFTTLFSEEEKSLFVLTYSQNNSSLRSGDKVLKLNGKEIISLEHFQSLLKESGDTANLTIQRGPNIFDLNVERISRIKIFPEIENCPRRDYLLNKQSVISSENKLEGTIAKINLSISELFLQREERALSILDEIGNLQEMDFLSPTIKYLKSISLIRLNRNQEAKTLLNEIKINHPSSVYLDNESKILLLPLVEDLLKSI